VPRPTDAERPPHAREAAESNRGDTTVHVEPDARAAADERSTLARITLATLARVDLGVDADEATHPAVTEAAHLARTLLRDEAAEGPSPTRRAALARTLDQARAGVGAPDPLWPIELAPPRDHLRRAAARTPGASPGTPLPAVVAWRAADVEAFDRAIHLLATVWPSARDELTRCTSQIALLRGETIDAHTDFVVHGAILVDRAHVGSPPRGLPARVRLAELLVRETAHTRCDAAGVTGPLLGPAATASERRDLAGLLRQAVGTTRRVLLHERVLGHDPAPPPSITQRRDRLAREAAGASATLARRRDAFTDRGNAVLDEVATLTRHLRNPRARG